MSWAIVASGANKTAVLADFATKIGDSTLIDSTRQGEISDAVTALLADYSEGAVTHVKLQFNHVDDSGVGAGVVNLIINE